MLAAGLSALVHLIVGVGAGYFFRVMMLIAATALSVGAMVVICLITGADMLELLIVSELSLQIGYVAGSMAAMLGGHPR